MTLSGTLDCWRIESFMPRGASVAWPIVRTNSCTYKVLVPSRKSLTRYVFIRWKVISAYSKRMTIDWKVISNNSSALWVIFTYDRRDGGGCCVCTGEITVSRLSRWFSNYFRNVVDDFLPANVSFVVFIRTRLSYLLFTSIFRYTVW